MSATDITADGRNPVVLIVDDEVPVLTTYSMMLEKEGFKTLVAENFETAEEIIKKVTLDTVLCDVFLGNFNGMDLLARTMAHQPQTPFIMMTGFPERQSARDALASGAYDFLTKPVGSQSLACAIQRAVTYSKLLRTKEIIEIENQNYKESLELLVEERTRSLREREAQYRDLFENATDLIQSVDVAGRFLKVNKKWRDTLGYSTEELEGLNLRDIVHPRHRAHSQAVFKKVISGKVQQEMETVFVSKSGRAVALEGNINCHFVAGKPMFTRGIFRDISERKKAQLRIRGQQKFLKNVIEALTHPFFVVNVKDYTLSLRNTATRIKRDRSSRTCYGLIYGADAPCWKQGIDCPVVKIAQEGLPVRLEQTRLDREGNTRHYEIYGFPIFRSGEEIVQVICYSFDISERKYLESIAEAANLMDNLGYIFSGIRHEIGNPINTSKMALTVLDKHLDTYSVEKIREFVQRSLGELSRVEYLLKALKNFSLFENPVISPVRMQAFFDNFVALVKDDFSSKGIAITTRISGDTAIARTDPRALHQVMLNLLTNAADALDGGTIPRIGIKVSRAGERVEIVVQDNGCGMSAAQMENLFKPFFTSKKGGTGLGLVIARKMVVKMEGTITVESRKGIGTAFTISLPGG